ncbi:MAG: phosphoglycerate dehydrogenase [Coxiellaceae bacterium]|nr:phosphoglycerate dehydrogenase [Coxiellaceae bacterium]
MPCIEKIAVTSRSFSKHKRLRIELEKKFKHIKYNESGKKLMGDNLIDFLWGFDRAIIGLETVNEQLLSSLPHLKKICKIGTGVDKINFDDIKKNKVEFSNTPGLNKRSVAELVIMMAMIMLRKIKEIMRNVENGAWTQPRGTLLTNKVFGIIGYGAIGQDLAKLLRSYSCKCLVYDVIKHDNLLDTVKQVDIETLLQESEVISLHIPLLDETRHFIDTHKLRMIRHDALLINTARGGLIDEEALYDCLKNHAIAGAALDVLEQEPDISSKLLALDNCFITSHIGGSTEEAIYAMGMAAINYISGGGSLVALS